MSSNILPFKIRLEFSLERKCKGIDFGSCKCHVDLKKLFHASSRRPVFLVYKFEDPTGILALSST